MITDHLSYRLKTSGTWDDTIALLRRHIEHVDEYAKDYYSRAWMASDNALDAILMNSELRRRQNTDCYSPINPHLIHGEWHIPLKTQRLTSCIESLLGGRTTDRRYYRRSKTNDSLYI